MNVAIMLSRCSLHKQLFGVRLEEQGRAQWIADWAFALKENVAAREGYGRSKIAGRFTVAPGYPGCPGCRAGSFFACGCGKVGCWDGESKRVTCPWCGRTGELSGEVTILDTSMDR